MNPSKEDILAAYQDEIKKYQNEGESFQVITDEGLWNSSFKYFHVVLGKIRGYSICLFRSALAAKTVLVIAVLAVVSEGLQIGHASHEQAAALNTRTHETQILTNSTLKRFAFGLLR